MRTMHFANENRKAAKFYKQIVHQPIKLGSQIFISKGCTISYHSRRTLKEDNLTNSNRKSCCQLIIAEKNSNGNTGMQTAKQNIIQIHGSLLVPNFRIPVTSLKQRGSKNLFTTHLPKLRWQAYPTSI